MVLGGTYIVNSIGSSLADQRVETLASLSYNVTGLAFNLERERDQTMEYIGLNSADGGRVAGLASDSADQTAAAPNEQLVKQTQELSQPWIADVRRGITGIGTSFPAQVQQDAQQIGALLNSLASLRAAATQTDLPATDVLTKYTSVIDELLTIDNSIALSSGDPTLTADVRALNLVSLIEEEASEQRGLLAFAFAEDAQMTPQILSDLTTAQAAEQANVAEFDRSATAQQVAFYTNTVAGGLVDTANADEQQAIQFGQQGSPLTGSPETANDWFGRMTTGTVEDIRTVELHLVNSTTSRATTLHRGAILTASLVGAAVLVVLLLALILTTVVGRSMVRPLRRLRSGALEVAGVRLPETVRRMSESDGAGASLDIEPIDVDSSDEIGEVARAFDQVHREALRLAANEAALRGNVNAMFVNLSRRSQSLVERQIRLIDDLEQGEQDPDRLSSLFQMDHLATRMRRNSENLLVLAGHEATRRWNQPVALVDVLRAAVSEIEQYERVTLNVQPGIAVRGHAVNDVVHLLAELAENATSFSSAETPVVVAGHLLSSGGVLLDITDRGVGMGAEEMAHANWRLDNPPVVDVAVSRRMGLFVVARLAARHGIRVRLRPAPAGGLTALVWLPDEVVSHEVGSTAPGMRRFDMPVGAGGAPDLNGRIEPTAAERAINAARSPSFAAAQQAAAQQADAPDSIEGPGPLGPRRVPGAGLHPGSAAGWGGAATTGPLPAVGVSDDDVYAAPGSFGPGGNAGAMDARSPSRAEIAAAQSPITLGRPAVSAAPGGNGGPGGSGSGGAGNSGVGAVGNGGRMAGAQSAGAAGVVVPPAEHVATANRLPIFEAVESDWFRRGRSGLGGWPAQQAGAGAPSEPAWVSPSDEGWEAAAAASSPATGGTTTAGLPKRVPQANLVPGTATPEAATVAPARSAAVTRERFASFQRGSREGRAAASGGDGRQDADDHSR
ncbi:MAG TPA: nitrate- and nitrite sensing domain-containing protein [Streptosporangiaceae bacterium]